MSGLLDNLEKNNYSDGDEDDHINRLFPKCKPRASSLQPATTTTTLLTGGNIDDSLSSGSRTSLTDSSSLTNSHKNINTLNNNNNNLLEERNRRYHEDDEEDEDEPSGIIKNGLDDYDQESGLRCVNRLAKRATGFVENNNSVVQQQQGHHHSVGALAYPGKATRANNTTTSGRSANTRSARNRRHHHHHHSHHHQQPPPHHHQSNIEFKNKEFHISQQQQQRQQQGSVKRNSCGNRIMECDSLADHFDNGIESGGSGSSGASALSHSSSFSMDKNLANAPPASAALSSASGLAGSSGSIGLRDSRIEIAGGREIYSQNRIKAGRRVRGSSSMDSMLVAQQELTPAAVTSSSQATTPTGTSSFAGLGQHQHHQPYQSSPSQIKGRRKPSTNSTNPLISPTSPVSTTSPAPCNNIWEPHHPVANKKNFPFSSSSGRGSEGRRVPGTASRHIPSGGSHSYLRNSKQSSHSHQYYPYREYPADPKKSPSLDGFDMMMSNSGRNPFPQVHQSPKSPTAAASFMKETVFDSEITCIEKPIMGDGTQEQEEGSGSGKQQQQQAQRDKSFIYETPIDGGGEIVFDDIGETQWRREGSEQHRQQQHPCEDKEGTFDSVGDKGSQLNFSAQSMKSDDGGDEDEESDSLVMQQHHHRRLLYHHHGPQSDIPPPRSSTSPTCPTGYESDECASSSVLGRADGRTTSPYNGNKRLIGNIPIAEYEGSPKRYGLRLPTEAKPSHLEIVDPNSPTITHLSVTTPGASTTTTTALPTAQLSPRIHSSPNFTAATTTRLPGFPHRVVDTSPTLPQQAVSSSVTPIKPILSESPTTEYFIGERRESGGNKSDDVMIMSPHANSDVGGGCFSGRNSPLVANPGVSSSVTAGSSTAGASGGGGVVLVGGATGKLLGTTDTSPDDSIASQQGSNNTAATNSSAEEAELSASNRCDLSGLEDRDSYLLYEFSETRKVLDEFFKPAEGDTRLIGFDDLDYTLRRQAGNSYVGQRLAAESCTAEPGGTEESPKKGPPTRRSVQLNISSEGGASPKLISFQEVASLPVSSSSSSQLQHHNSHHHHHHRSSNNGRSHSSVSPSSAMLMAGGGPPLLDPSVRDVNDNDIEIETASTNTETDLGDTEVGLQVGHSRNFTLSPETTDCDSNELESEISLDFEASLHSSSRIGATMPVLEDGLSSGNVSDNEDRDQDELLERTKRNMLLANRKLANSGKILMPSSSSTAAGNAVAGLPNSSSTPNCTTSTAESNPTLLLMKKQISEIEKEIKLRSQRVLHSESNGAATNGANNLPDSARKQMDSDYVAGRSEPNMFDCNDPELEALDPMRPTPPPSPAPSSMPAHLQAHHNSLQSSSNSSGCSSQQQQQQQPQMPLPGRTVSYTSSSSASRTATDGINICSSNSNAPTPPQPPGSSGSSHSGGAGGCLSSSGLGLLHSSADMILSGDSGIVSSSSASSDIHTMKDVSAGFPKSMSSSHQRSTLDHHATSTTSPPSSQREESMSQHNIPPEERLVSSARDTSPVWVPRHPVNASGNNPSHRSVNASVRDPLLGKQRYEEAPDDDADTDQETDRLLGQNRTDDDYGFYDDKEWKKVKSRSILPSMGKGVVSSFKSAASVAAAAAAAASTTPAQQAVASATAQLLNSTSTVGSSTNSTNHTVSQKSLVSQQQQQQQQLPQQQQQQVQSPTAGSSTNIPTSSGPYDPSSSSIVPTNNNNTNNNNNNTSNTSVPSKSKKEKDGVKKKRSKEDLVKNPAVLIEGVLFRARYLGSTQLVCEGQPTKATRMMQAEEAVSRIKAQANHNGNVCQLSSSSPSASTSPTSINKLSSSSSSSKADGPMSPFLTEQQPLQQQQQQQQQQLPPLQQSDISNSSYMYSNENHMVRGADGTLRTNGEEEEDDDAEDGVSDEACSVGDDDDYFTEKPVSAALGGTIVDTNALVAAESVSPSGGGRRLSSSSDSVGAGTAGGLGSAFGAVPSSGSSVPHLSPPYGSALPGTMFRLRFVGSLEVEEEVGSGRRRRKRPKKAMVEEVVTKLKAPEGETQPSTEVDLFISTEKIMVLNTDLKEIMMDHALRTISYIADIGDLVVLMARRRPVPSDSTDDSKIPRPPKMICHVFESDEAQYIAQSIGQAFQVAYMEFLKANGIEDHSFVREMDYQEVLNSQEIFGDELQMFAKKELQKEVVVPKTKGEILGVVIVESGWGSMLPTVVIANLAPAGAAARCGQLNIGDQIIAINGVSLVGLPLSTCQNYIKNTKAQTVVKLTVVPCPPVVEVKIKRPDTKYQLGFSVQNGVICSLLRGGIAERGGVRVGHRIIEINNQSVVAVPHEKIVNLLATSVGEINMKTMPTSMFRLLTGQETPLYI